MTKRAVKIKDKLDNNKIIGILIIAIISIIGVNILLSSHAQSPYVSFETESGNLTGQAQINTNTKASGGKYVSFGPFFEGKLLSIQAYSSDIPVLQQLHANSDRPEINFDTTTNTFSDKDRVGVTTESWMNETTTAHIETIPLMESYLPITPNSNVYIDPTTWANAVTTWCQQFCAGGSFYINNPNANSYYAPHILEILNEPYGGWYRGGAVPPIGYANMLIATRSALNKAGFSNIILLGDAGDASHNSWTTGVATAGGYGVVQGLAVHPYAKTNITLPGSPILQDGWDMLYYLHQTYNQNIYVTEVGWCVGDNTTDTGMCGGRDQTEDNKDIDISNAISQLATVSWIKSFNLYNLRSYSGCVNYNSSGICTLSEINSSGLIDTNGNQTPAYSAFQAASIANGF